MEDLEEIKHEVINAGLGITLELKHITQALVQIGIHLKRMEEACYAKFQPVVKREVGYMPSKVTGIDEHGN